MATLEVLRLGSKGRAVEQWQYFLVGRKLFFDTVDGIFGDLTLQATQAFQKLNGLEPEGVVGNKTYGAAMMVGFGVVKDSIVGKQNPSWPPKPDFSPLASDAQKHALFGTFKYTLHPLPDNKENIIIQGSWTTDNIKTIPIPQMRVFGRKSMEFHKLVAPQLKQLWLDWEEAGLLHLMLTWGGSFVPRLIRSGTSLSQHAFGTAFDINMNWNARGSVPALLGTKGCVRELVAIAHKNGFYWGGHFTNQDGMHFEIAKIIK